VLLVNIVWSGPISEAIRELQQGRDYLNYALGGVGSSGHMTIDLFEAYPTAVTAYPSKASRSPAPPANGHGRSVR
jgi:hypothetical protein